MLAIIIPFYKLTFFEATLESLANQTDKRFNVYIGDDQSPEDPIGLIEKYTGKFNVIYHRFENNLGSISLTQQWERCIELTDNEKWLMILGDDDMLGSNVIEEFYKQYHCFENVNNVVRYSTMTINSLGESLSVVKMHPKQEKAPNSLLRKIKGKNRSSLSEYFFLRSIYAKYGFANYPLAWHSDDHAWSDFSENKDIYSINEANLLIRISDLNISGRKDNLDKKLEATLSFFKDLIKYKREQFTRSDFLVLLLTTEIEIKKYRKLKQSEWFFLSNFYITNFQTLPALKFFRRYIISIFDQ